MVTPRVQEEKGGKEMKLRAVITIDFDAKEENYGTDNISHACAFAQDALASISGIKYLLEHYPYDVEVIPADRVRQGVDYNGIYRKFVRED